LDWLTVLLIIFGSLVILMAAGLPVALAFMTINVVGVFLLWGGADGLRTLTLSMWGSMASFLFMPIPMFFLLGELLFRSGMAMRAIDVIDKWMGRLPGRLALQAVGIATLLSTMTGSTIGTTAMLGDVLVPEMEKRGYKKPMSVGSIMGSGGLAMLIPPSGLAVLWAAIAEVSVGEVLIGGTVPGLIMALFYATYIIGRCWLQPSIAPAYDIPKYPWGEKLLDTARYVLPLGFIVFMVTGLIFIGAASPTEAAAMGALSGIIMSAIYHRLSWQMIKETLYNTLRITTMVLIIISGTKAFGQILAYTGVVRELTDVMVGLPLPPLALVAVMMFILLILGMFMSALPMIMITLPIFLPIIYELGFSPIWFGILFLINIEMGQSTPPFGYLLFVMKGVAPPGTTFGEIVKAGIPFLICDALCMGVVMAFPILALWLPGLMIR